MRPFARICAVVLFACVGTANAQSYPTKPVRVIVPFAAGGGTDVLARLVAAGAREPLGQTLVVENRAGAGTIIGTEAAAKSPPDGYTVLITLDQSMTMNPTLYDKLPYDPGRDFAPVSLLAVSSRLYVATLTAPGRNLRELVGYAKANPGKLNYGSGAISGQVVGEQLMLASGAKMVFVSYNGGAPALQALLAGDIQFVIADVTTFAPGVRDGRLKGLAVSGPKRVPQLPNVPTLREAGFPELEGQAWWAMFVPAGTPRAVVERLNAAVVKAIAAPETRQKIAALGTEPASSSSEQLAAMLKKDAATWGRIIRQAGIKAN